MTTRTLKKAALKEGIKNVLEELWDTEEEEPFYKIFSRECMSTKRMQKILRHSKAQLQELSYRDDDHTVYYLQKYEVRDVHILVYYQSHLIARTHFPEYSETFRLNLMTRKDCISFVDHPDAIALIREQVMQLLPYLATLCQQKTSKSLTLQLIPLKFY